jgi:apolipoprotein D and lipocalin family protein
MKNVILFLLLVLVSCTTKAPPLKKVESVDIKRFMGTWYVIANIPTIIEVGGKNAFETYTWNEKENRIDVDFRLEVDGEKKHYTQKAWVHDPSGNEWRIQFLWPFKFAYLILDLAPDYSYTVIGVPNRDYVWIMAREKTIPDATYQEIIKRLETQGYEISKILKVPQKI